LFTLSAGAYPASQLPPNCDIPLSAFFYGDPLGGPSGLEYMLSISTFFLVIGAR